MLNVIPLWARLAFVAAVMAICFAGGWEVNGWRLGTKVADLKTEHANAVADATAKTLAAQHKLDADHQALAADLAQSSAKYHEDLTRSEHANDLLRADVAAGTRVVRVAATCPAAAGAVPEAASGGRVDSATGPVLSPAAGQTVLDLRGRISATETQLAACQAAVMRITGQTAPKE